MKSFAGLTRGVQAHVLGICLFFKDAQRPIGWYRSLGGEPRQGREKTL